MVEVPKLYRVVIECWDGTTREEALELVRQMADCVDLVASAKLEEVPCR